MSRRVQIRPIADLDAAAHYEFLLTVNAPIADRFRQGLKSVYQRLASEYRSCATLAMPEFPDLELRFCRLQGLPRYYVVFQVTDDLVIVLRVLHESQDLPTLLRPPH